MSVLAALSGLSVLLALAAARELAALLAGRFDAVRLAALKSRGAGAAVPTPAKLAGAAAGGLLGWLALPAAPGRTALLVATALPLAGFLAPEAWLERRAGLRKRRLVSALPDALDLLAVSSLAGRGPAVGLAEIARNGSGPLAEELRLTVADIDCGTPLSDSLAALRTRVPGSETATLCAAIERSRELGSPLAEQVRRQARTLRAEHRLAVEERAARAAPKIQLVVALVLVPSVLLMIAAGLLANANTLLGGY